MDDQTDTETWYVVRRSDGVPEMYVVAYNDDADRYLDLLESELSRGQTVWEIGDAALVARLSACDSDEMDGVWITDIAHAWNAESGFSHAHN